VEAVGWEISNTKDEMDLIYMLIDLTGIRNIREQDEPDIGIM
jgi:hypothetical protein